MAHCRTVTDEKGNPVNYVILEVNEAYERIIGVKKADIDGRLVTEVFPGIENMPSDYIRKYGRIALQGGELLFEDFFPATGQWLLIYAYSPKPGEFAALFTDITAQKQAEEALRASEAQLQAVVDNIAEGIVVCDLEGNLVHWNRASLAMHGFASLDEARRRLPQFADIFELSTMDGTVLPLEQWPLSRSCAASHSRTGKFASAGSKATGNGSSTTAARWCATRRASRSWRW